MVIVVAILIFINDVTRCAVTIIVSFVARHTVTIIVGFVARHAVAIIVDFVARRAVTIIVGFFARRAVTIIVGFVARRAVAIIVTSLLYLPKPRLWCVPTKDLIPKDPYRVFLWYRLVKYREKTERYRTEIPNRDATLVN